MQYGFIITEIDSYSAEHQAEVFRLNVKDHRARHISVMGLADQQVNIQTLKCQVLPAVMLTDKLEVKSEVELNVPASSLVSIVPISSVAVQAILDAGKAEEVLQSISLKSC